MESSKPSEKSLRKCNADRIFLVDLPGNRVVSYREMLADVCQPGADRCGREAARGGTGGAYRSENGDDIEHRSENGYYGDGYYIVLRVIADVVRNRDCDLCGPTEYSLAADAGLAVPPSLFLSPDGTFDGEALAARILSSSSHITLSTSGTTGSPKPIRQSISNIARAVQISPKHANDVWGLAYQPTKIAGLQVLLQALCNGNTLVNLYGLPAPAARERIREFQISHLSATPTYFRLLAADSEPFPLVKAITVGGEVADAKLRTRLQQIFPNAKFRNVYASSEMGTLLQSAGDAFLVPESLRNMVRVQEGRLWVHQSLLAENLQNNHSEEFWDTGDEVEIVSDDPLQLRITGRRSDWINVGGMKVNPHDIEAALSAMPGVLDARAYGIANSVTGSLVAAELSVDASFSLSIADIRKRLQGLLPAYAIPRVINFNKGIAISPSGKKERRD